MRKNRHKLIIKAVLHSLMLNIISEVKLSNRSVLIILTSLLIFLNPNSSQVTCSTLRGEISLELL